MTCRRAINQAEVKREDIPSHVECIIETARHEDQTDQAWNFVLGHAATLKSQLEERDAAIIAAIDHIQRFGITTAVCSEVDKLRQLMYMPQRPEQVCEWRVEDHIIYGDAMWKTSCGAMFEFANDGPSENGFHYCYNCGKPVEVVREDIEA